jgi:hypothetical protein
MTTAYAGFRIRDRAIASAREPGNPPSERMQQYRANGDAAVAESYRGITAGGLPATGLFPLQQTGISTQPISEAARAFLAMVSPEQRQQAQFALDSDVWRRWSNIHVFTMRHGAWLEEMSAGQRERAIDLLRQSLSPSGFETARSIMKLNEVIGEITGRWEEYGEWLYWLSIMGTPSESEPWGWQIDGHHLIVNCLVLGDQVVMTPMFMGSEPVSVDEGKYAGTSGFRAEEADGLHLMQGLAPEHRNKAVLAPDLPREVFTSAFRDNFELRYEGLPYTELSTSEQAALLNLIELYVGRVRPGHAQVKMDEVKRHLRETYFAWMGGCADDSVFYYRIHSPVILIEFDHQSGVALDSEVPSRDHIHTVVRTPNGNDYGKDLLRQHYERSH